MGNLPIIQVIVGWGILLLGIGTALQHARSLLPDADQIHQFVVGFALALTFFGLCCLSLTALHCLSFLSLTVTLSMGIGWSAWVAYQAGAKPRMTEAVGVLGICFCMGIFSLNASEYLWGQWDPGIYNNRAFALMQEGSFRIPDRSLATLGEEWRTYYATDRTSHKYVGVSRHPEVPELLTPSFFPALPCMAAGLGLLIGKAAIFTAPSILMVFSALLLFGFMHVWMGRAVALAALLAFVLNPVLLWFSSFPTGEVASLSFLLCLLFLWRCMKGKHPWLLALCVVLLSLSSVVGLLLSIMLSLLIVFTLCSRSSWKLVVLAVPSVGLGQWAQHSIWSPRYAEQLSHYLPHGLSFVPVLMVVGLAVLPLVGRLRRWEGRTPNQAWSPGGMVMLLALALLWEALGIKELISWTRGSAMFSNWGSLGIFVGAGIWVYRKGGHAFYILLITLAYTLLFLWSPMMSDNFPWAYKRFLVLTVPLACCALGVLGGEALGAGKRSRKLLLLMYVLSLALPLYHGRHWAFAREWQGTYDLLSEVDQTLPEEAVLFAPTPYAEPMEFVFGRKVLPIYTFAEDGSLPPYVVKTAEAVKASGQQAYFLWPRRMRALDSPEIQQVGQFRPTVAPYKLMQAPVPYRSLDRRKKLVVDLRLDEYLGVQKKRLE